MATDDPISALLARARIAIDRRRDREAQADLREAIGLDPDCALAFRLLGEIAARNDRHDHAAMFFREALRLDPQDDEARDWLAIALAAERNAQSHARFAQGTTPPPLRAERRGIPPWTRPPPEPSRAVDATPSPVLAPRPQPRGAIPELPGFPAYLLQVGVLDDNALETAQAYQRALGVPLAAAIITLGLASPQRVEWAAVSHQATLARART